ncbi:MAG TPA: hypothetical protein VL400_06065, partial [Polyangiaceae bacterium]|nr:hypothetical protein [Polyangiaceae bacterium]
PSRDIPKHVDDLVLKALARHATLRFAGAREMRRAIDVALEVPLRSRAKRRIAGFVAVAAVMAGAVGVLAVGGPNVRHSLADAGRSVVGRLGSKPAPTAVAEAPAAVAPPDERGSIGEAEAPNVAPAADPAGAVQGVAAVPSEPLAPEVADAAAPTEVVALRDGAGEAATGDVDSAKSDDATATVREDAPHPKKKKVRRAEKKKKDSASGEKNDKKKSKKHKTKRKSADAE